MIADSDYVGSFLYRLQHFADLSRIKHFVTVHDDENIPVMNSGEELGHSVLTFHSSFGQVKNCYNPFGLSSGMSDSNMSTL
jgi:hypothetical protein